LSPLELTAALFGAVSVYLSARQNVLSWPTALVNVGLSTIVFRDQRLYADMGLQVVYFALSLYGWYQWKFGGVNRSELRVTRLAPNLAGGLFVLNLVAWLALGSWLARAARHHIALRAVPHDAQSP
jgi:nicotinamide mononucleotide transporter